MAVLPSDNILPINLLASCFNNTSATYKFYWFISLIEEVEKGHHHISKQNLFAGMIANAWYTVNYFNVSFGILKAFCYWNLSLYLQKHNPNVPDIPNKLIKPPLRNSLSKQRKDFWDVVIHHHGPVNCIYTQRELNIGDYAVEHFVPYAFVSHDLIWNLIPADHSFNSSKCDKLPPIKRYFDPYFDLQMIGLTTVLTHAHNKNTLKLMEDYLTFIPDLAGLNSLDRSVLRTKFKDNIEPLITIASNNGFEFIGA